MASVRLQDPRTQVCTWLKYLVSAQRQATSTVEHAVGVVVRQTCLDLLAGIVTFVDYCSANKWKVKTYSAGREGGDVLSQDRSGREENRDNEGFDRHVGVYLS